MTKLPLIARPYLRLLKRLLLGPGTPNSVAAEVEVLCDREISTVDPPEYFSEDLEQITSTPDGVAPGPEITSMLRTTIEHEATIAFHVRDAAIVDGSIYCGSMRHFISDKKLFRQRSPTIVCPTGALASTVVGNKYFGHWLVDDCVQYQLAEARDYPLAIRGLSSAHKDSYARYFEQDWTPTDRAVCDQLIIYQDFAQNSFKKARYGRLVRKISAAFPSKLRHKLIYLRRGTSGTPRPIYKEEELIGQLIKYGFEVVNVDAALDHILATLREAKLVISIEGSQVNHCSYTLDDRSALLVLQPPDRFAAFQRHWAACLGVRFGFVVGQQTTAGSYFSSSKVLQLVERLLRPAHSHTTWSA